jgi:hypothetical protein
MENQMEKPHHRPAVSPNKQVISRLTLGNSRRIGYDT